MEEENIELINKTNAEVISYLKLLPNYTCYEFVIDVNKFSVIDFNLPEKVLLQEYNQLLKPIENKLNNKPCVYTFEIIQGETRQIIETYKKSEKKNKAALKKQIDYNTNCLYVGKSKATIKHRLRVHFGYRNTTEKGLQLLHWAKPLKLKLNLNIYVFQKELDFLLPLYEAKFKTKINPLIGYL